MDGYSVSEAASVLGVPIERVWELLARGVLAGAPEGETGMRVFLQPRPAPAPAPPVAAPPTNGGSAEPDRELSPFRELLTEFRNLTERYGQALLALGESRGEVAALRSRVDLLEARMDLGLPPPGRARGGWAGSAPFPAETVIPAPAPSDADEPDDHGEHRARPRGPRRATESFAEALARAEDPTAPELPAAEAEEHQRAMHDEPALPRELPAAETVPVADEVTEFDADASQDVAAEAQAEVEVEAVVEAVAEPDPASVADAVEPNEPAESDATEDRGAAEADVAADQTAADDAAPLVQPVGAAAEAEPEPTETTEPTEPPEVAEPMEPTWDTERYTAAIEEPDWYAAEADDESPEPEPDAGEAPPTVTAEADEEPPAAAVAAEAAEPAVTPAAPEGPAEEETVLWLGQEATATTLPGGDELDSALEALAASESADATDAVAAARAEPQADGDAPLESAATPEPAPQPPADRHAPAVPPSALRYRPVTPAGPTGRAYRRLRRIFPD